MSVSMSSLGYSHAKKKKKKNRTKIHKKNDTKNLYTTLLSDFITPSKQQIMLIVDFELMGKNKNYVFKTKNKFDHIDVWKRAKRFIVRQPQSNRFA